MERNKPNEPYIDGAVPTRPLEETNPFLAASAIQDAKRIAEFKLWLKGAREEDEFPELIGDDYELWQQYHETFGKVAYKYRRLYEETSKQLFDVYTFAEENGIDLPNTGPDFK